MPAKSELPQEEYSAHRILATQVETLYVEINKLATKKPTERITPLISKKLNHVLFKIRSQVLEDEFLDAIDTLPVEGEDQFPLFIEPSSGSLDIQVIFVSSYENTEHATDSVKTSSDLEVLLITEIGHILQLEDNDVAIVPGLHVLPEPLICTVIECDVNNLAAITRSHLRVRIDQRG